MNPQQGNLEAHTSPLKIILGSTSFPGSPESTANSNLHPMSSAIITRHLSSQQTVTGSSFQGTLPMFIWFHMAMIMTKTNPSVTFPSLLHSPSGIQSPLPCSHSPSKFHWHPHPGQSIPWKGFLTSKDKKPRHIPASTHHTSHSMLIEINGHYWVPRSHNGPAPEYFTSMLLHDPISFVVAANSCSQFQPPNWAFHLFLLQAHNFH